MMMAEMRKLRKRDGRDEEVAQFVQMSVSNSTKVLASPDFVEAISKTSPKVS